MATEKPAQIGLGRGEQRARPRNPRALSQRADRTIEFELSLRHQGIDASDCDVRLLALDDQLSFDGKYGGEQLTLATLLITQPLTSFLTNDQ